MGLILEARELDYQYENGTKALQSTSFSVEAGARLAVLGENGSGKSTLFLCLNGVLRPKKGEILLDGKPIGSDKKSLQQLRQSVGIVFQDPETQLFCVDVWQEVAFGPYHLGLRGAQLNSTVEQTLAQLSLATLHARPPHTLSGGQKKKVSIASVLSMHPRILIFDEPTGSLDPYHTAQFLALLEELHDAGIAVVLSTHDIDFAWSWAEQIAVLSAGSQIAKDYAEKIFLDQKLLEQTHLRQPTLLTLYHKLVAQGVLSGAQSAPRTTAQLLMYLEGGR